MEQLVKIFLERNYISKYKSLKIKASGLIIIIWTLILQYLYFSERFLILSSSYMMLLLGLPATYT